jgi:ABC-type transporter Mla MlaB component
MPIRIAQTDDYYRDENAGPNDPEMKLKVEGQLLEQEAELLEKVCRELAGQSHKRIALDLATISFLDSDSAAVLCRLKRELGVKLEGLNLFIGKVVELAEEYERVKKYRLDVPIRRSSITGATRNG